MALSTGLLITLDESSSMSVFFRSCDFRKLTSSD